MTDTVIVTGGAGFIGSHLTDELLAEGYAVRVLDNLSTGRMRFLEAARRKQRFELIDCDLLSDRSRLPDLLGDASAVVHLAANADVRFGWAHPRRDMEQNTLATHNVLEAMRVAGVPRLVFASTGSVYGEAPVTPTPEDAPFPRQTSLYGASKLAAEGLIAAYAEGCGLRTTILRFVSILGPRYTHGHVFDFVRQLTSDPARLSVLGDGSQRKSYLHVRDCCAAITSLLLQQHAYEVYNLGRDDYCTLDASIAWICERLDLNPAVSYKGGDRGWIGDNPFIYLDTAKIRATGWKPAFGIRESVEATVDYLRENQWVFAEDDRRVETIPSVK